MEWQGRPCLVAAPPGTGKSTTCAYTVDALIKRGIWPEHILAISFTKKAARELRDKCIALNPKAAAARISTMHSLCYSFLQEISKFEMITSDGKIKSILRQVIEANKLDSQINLDLLKLKIRGWKNQGKTPADVFKQLDEEQKEFYNNPEFNEIGDFEDESLYVPVYEVYEKFLVETNQVDFDGLLLNTWVFLRQDKNFREKAQEKFRFAILDEAQDTNLVQYKILETLIEKHRNFMVVGDSAQSIYKWRLARPEEFESFPQRYENCQVIFLKTTYRATPEILSGYSRIGKILLDGKFETAFETIKPSGLPPEVFQPEDETKEAEMIVEQVEKLRESYKLTDMAVLVRTNAQSLALAQAFVQAQIPYFVAAQINFFDRAEIKLLVDWLKLAYNINDDEALENVIMSPIMPLKYFKKKALEKMRVMLQKDQPLRLGLRVENWKPFEQQKADWLALTLSDVSRYIRIGQPISELVKFIRRVTQSDALWTIDEEADSYRLENVDAFERMATGFTDLQVFLNYIEESKKHQLFDDEKKPDGVEISTVHKAKGREWACVFVAGLVEGCLPHYKSQPEDERCVGYVALSRAAERLFLYAPQQFRRKPVFPSRFLREAGFYLENSNKEEFSGKMT